MKIYKYSLPNLRLLKLDVNQLDITLYISHLLVNCQDILDSIE